MANMNPLLQPPFFLIPGIDPSAPVSAQTEQVDQLNTLLLQEIDANFAKFHQIITAKVLPEIKRFALASEPTREAANFWRTFFEAASAVRLPTSELTMTMDQSGSQDVDASYEDDEDNTLTGRRDMRAGQHDDLSLDGDAPSFFGAAASSTPLPNRQIGSTGGMGAGSGYAPGFAAYDDESFAASIESPFERFGRQLQDELQLSPYGAEESSGFSSLPPHLADVGGGPGGYESSAGHISVGAMGMDLGGSRRDEEEGEAGGAATPRASTRPLGGTSAAQGQEWTGLTDLRTTPLNVKFKLKPGVKVPGKSGSSSSSGQASHSSSLANFTRELDQLSLQRPDSRASSAAASASSGPTFNMPSRAAAFQKAVRTPVRGSGASATGDKNSQIPANLILADLMQEMEMESMSSPGPIRTPEGLRRYSVMPADLSAAGSARNQSSSLSSYAPRQAGNASGSSSASSVNIFGGAAALQSRSNQPIYEDDEADEDDTFHAGSHASHHSHQQSYNAGLAGGFAHPALHQQPESRRSLANTSFGSDIQDIPPGSGPPAGYSNDVDDSLDMSHDSFSDDDDSGQIPSSAFSGSVLSHQSGLPHSSLGSVMGSGASTQHHPPARGHELLDDDDDSFMSDMSFAQPGLQRPAGGNVSGGDTVFGASAAAAAAGSNRFGSGPAGAGGAAGRGKQFELMKMDEMDTYYGGRLEDADMGFSPLGERQRKE